MTFQHRQPETVYINWAAYDELSDNVELTEELAMRQLDELLRLRRCGVRLDYYLMDAFWYDPRGTFREWRKPNWPHGPDRWLRRCLDNDVKPGLWFPTNMISHMQPQPRWEASLNRDRWAYCLCDGPYLPELMRTFQYWYDRGVRMFKLDFAQLTVATPRMESRYLPSEIEARNSDSLRTAFIAFRKKNPSVRFLAYNGFGGQFDNTSLPLRKTVDTRWLSAFDSLYCGDPRPADVPCHNFWRSKDIYSDHMVRQYELNGVPIERIDNTAFMIGTTGTCYYRRNAAWKGMLILSLARGGWMNTYYGNLDLLDNEAARWFARVQAMFLPLQARRCIASFGAQPGTAQPYGFIASDKTGALFTVINPSQALRSIKLPVPAEFRRTRKSRLLFTDQGFVPQLTGNTIMLGPEQMAVVGMGQLADEQYDLGVEPDVIIPHSIRQLKPQFFDTGRHQVVATIKPVKNASLRIIFQQFDGHKAFRSTGGAPPKGKLLGQILKLSVTQASRTVPVTVNYDKAIWSGLSWAVGEISTTDLRPGVAVKITGTSSEAKKLRLEMQVFAVTYAGTGKK